MRTRYSALLLVLSLLPGSLHAQIYVDDNGPGDPLPFDRQISDRDEDGSADHPFDSIQEAIEAADDGDTIIVAPGRYLSPDPWQYDEINFKGKNIRLVGSAPTDFSVVEQTILCGVVIFQGNEDPNCLLQGFKIQNHMYGGILGNYTQAAISHCIISGNGPCGATVLKDVQGRVSNCLIVDNTTFHGCEIRPVVSGCTHLINCTITNNISGIEVSGPSRSGEPAILRNCILHGNKGYLYIPTTFEGRLDWRLHTEIAYCLIETRTGLLISSPIAPGLADHGTQEIDPYFMRVGYWVGGSSHTTRINYEGISIPVYPVGSTLVEGDYHLRSEGFCWSERELHGTHWCFGFETSCAIDAGDPTDGLGEELERGPDDPEGRWGVNHAIDLGAYGGTSQASLAPTQGRALGVGGVDLRDYLPLGEANSWYRGPDRYTSRYVKVWDRQESDGYEVYWLRDDSPLGTRDFYCVYIDYTLYTIQYPIAETKVVLSQPKEAKYPQILTVGSTIEAPADLFGPDTSPHRTAVVLRGTLAEVLAGTTLDPNQLINSGDVIAIREKMADGTAGEPIELFGRGIGPLLLDGKPTNVIRLASGTRELRTADSSAGTATSP